MLDHYIWGDVHRISPEAPVPVVHVENDTWAAGGAANVALNLANLGVKTSLLGYLGVDEAGNRLRQILADHHVEISSCYPSSPEPTIIKTRVMARGQQLCRIDRECSQATYSLAFRTRLLGLLGEALPSVDAVILSDYAKGVIQQEVVELVSSQSKSLGKFLAMDPKPARRLNLRGCNLLTPNRAEALELAGISDQYPTTSYPLKEVARKIHELHLPELLVITLGADGMAICAGGQVLETIPTVAREVFDVSGAGDTVIATLTAALALGVPPGSAARLANTAAGCVVAHMGTAPVNRQELSYAISSSPSQIVG